MSAGKSGLEQPGVLDAFAFDERAGRVVLAMFETRPWTGGAAQGMQLQDKLNAYVSFALDGELAEQFPELAEKPVTIQLRTVHEPGEAVLGFLKMATDQLALQDVVLETVLIGEGEAPEPGCGGGCSCQ